MNDAKFGPNPTVLSGAWKTVAAPSFQSLGTACMKCVDDRGIQANLHALYAPPSIHVQRECTPATSTPRWVNVDDAWSYGHDDALNHEPKYS